jgi:hypothetical protein
MKMANDNTQPGSGRFLTILMLLALVSVASLAWAPLDRLAPPDMDPQMFRWLALIQPAILVIGATFLGHKFAPRVGPDAPLLRAVVSGDPLKPVLIRQMGPAMAGAAISGAILICYSAVAISPPFELPLITKLLYGGIAEELMARWGVMSFGVWLVFRLHKSKAEPQAYHFWIGNIVAAGLFAAGHLPLLLALSTPLSSWLLAAVFICNMAPALIFGWLFTRHGLEAAIAAHAGAHLWTGVLLTFA